MESEGDRIASFLTEKEILTIKIGREADSVEFPSYLISMYSTIIDTSLSSLKETDPDSENLELELDPEIVDLDSLLLIKEMINARFTSNC